MDLQAPRTLLPPTVIDVRPISTDWKEFMALDGAYYYYNEKTKQTTWDKPAELMDALERADALTVWQEFCTPFGDRYYFNTVTKESVWNIPDKLKVCRELVEKASDFYRLCKGKNLNIYNVDLQLDNENEETKFLCDLLQQLLHDKIDKVQVSKLLRSPCVLYSAKIGLSSNMRRVTLSQKQVIGTTTKLNREGLTFEINPDHPIVNKLNVLLKNKPDSAAAKAVAEFLYEVALICSESAPKTPARLYDTIYRILEIGLAGSSGKSDTKMAEAADGEEANLESKPMEGLINSVLGILTLI